MGCGNCAVFINGGLVPACVFGATSFSSRSSGLGANICIDSGVAGDRRNQCKCGGVLYERERTGAGFLRWVRVPGQQGVCTKGCADPSELSRESKLTGKPPSFRPPPGTQISRNFYWTLCCDCNPSGDIVDVGKKWDDTLKRCVPSSGECGDCNKIDWKWTRQQVGEESGTPIFEWGWSRVDSDQQCKTGCFPTEFDVNKKPSPPNKVTTAVQCCKRCTCGAVEWKVVERRLKSNPSGGWFTFHEWRRTGASSCTDECKDPNTSPQQPMPPVKKVGNNWVSECDAIPTYPNFNARFPTSVTSEDSYRDLLITSGWPGGTAADFPLQTYDALNAEQALLASREGERKYECCTPKKACPACKDVGNPKPAPSTFRPRGQRTGTRSSQARRQALYRTNIKMKGAFVPNPVFCSVGSSGQKFAAIAGQGDPRVGKAFFSSAIGPTQEKHLSYFNFEDFRFNKPGRNGGQHMVYASVNCPVVCSPTFSLAALRNVETVPFWEF
jgi:hypothetical protein